MFNLNLNWSEFLRIAIAVAFIGSGVAIGITSSGNILQLIGAFILAGIGIALIAAGK